MICQNQWGSASSHYWSLALALCQPAAPEAPEPARSWKWRILRAREAREKEGGWSSCLFYEEHFTPISHGIAFGIAGFFNHWQSGCFRHESQRKAAGNRRISALLAQLPFRERTSAPPPITESSRRTNYILAGARTITIGSRRMSTC